MKDLRGKVAVVTGAASGIGLALTKTFLADGMKVVMADIETDALATAAAGLGESAEVDTFICDVSDAAQVDALRDRTLERFGGVHVVCNNAGVAGGGPVWTQTRADWDWVLGVNLFGVINGITSFTPLLIDQGEGHIVNTASVAGLISMPFGGTYNVSKHAVVTLSETLHADLQLAGAPGVGVTVLCPGWVQTRIHESHRNRPAGDGGADSVESEDAKLLTSVIGGLIAEGLNPLQVAGMVRDAVVADRFYVLTHPTWNPLLSDRFDRILAGENPGLSPLPGMFGGDE